ncbi:MAG: hypothetical protein LGR52_02350 [Candidatus Thiosymbion ectosymbiont of Robbea hypermnestra]|nr:hypothetical protein [Candidatus Thiosymbion ectosymbiont of Robbea hypermnestra]
MYTYHGKCRCGETSFKLQSGISVSDFKPRSDDKTCEFCSTYDGVWVADPNGLALIDDANETDIKQFGAKTVKFHFCKHCNDMCYAIYIDPTNSSHKVAVLRLGVIEEFKNHTYNVIQTDFRGEDEEKSKERRLDLYLLITD